MKRWPSLIGILAIATLGSWWWIRAGDLNGHMLGFDQIRPGMTDSEVSSILKRGERFAAGYQEYGWSSEDKLWIFRNCRKVVYVTVRFGGRSDPEADRGRVKSAAIQFGGPTPGPFSPGSPILANPDEIDFLGLVLDKARLIQVILLLVAFILIWLVCRVAVRIRRKKAVRSVGRDDVFA